ncbi:YtxH domain-containing protein [Arthrobacter sp. H-02-3]|uniref:YtxH domain-containing protein n=1 Tax=Arthrobacter sp. H-02-3 TaxID=2703675 RepID=UPI000DD1C930|nr:YtxH domain-containing protein [Arthrobacter sp. H-02-3]PVZ60263.1 hypothetical protein C9424_03130 [Arthrobacter sp. H-02-3]
MKGKLLFGAGLAAGYVLGSRSGREAYEKLKSRTTDLWHSKPVQDKLTAAAETVKDKAPEVSGQLTEAARRAGTVIGSAVHRDAGPEMSAPVAADVQSDPALTDQDGQDWSDEGGATPAGPATSVEADKLP